MTRARSQLNVFSTAVSRIVQGVHGTVGDGKPDGKSYRRLRLDALYTIKVKHMKVRAKWPELEAVVSVIFEKELAEYGRTPDAKGFRKVMESVVSVITVYGMTRDLSRTGAPQAVAKKLAEGLEPQSKWLLGITARARAPRPSDIQRITSFSDDEWNRLEEEVRTERLRIFAPGLQALGEDEDIGDTRIAERLSRQSSGEAPSEQVVPDYDQSDDALRITRIKLEGFRGSPGELLVELVKNGKPATVLMWGDNGVGKSTVVDAIEFALQGRIDRSADFNSSLRPSARNLNAKQATVKVELSDDSQVIRSIASVGGRETASGDRVRAGFRIAPVVIRRADIMRFLDTETISRATVFFDYFPEPDGEIGQRPDEEMRMLEEERFALRVVRDDLARELQDALGVGNRDLGNAGALQKFVDDELLAPIREQAMFADPWDGVDAQVRNLIRKLRGVQSRMATVRKILDKGVENLNPVAYREQLARITPALEAVTGDLTSSFRRITRAQHVKEIRALVAKSGPVSLDVVVDFESGQSAFPQQVFSEAYKDLVALLFFLALADKSSQHGQAKVLILDDVLQSVDATIRIDVMDYVFDVFKDWQLIITGHDRGWQNQLSALMNQKGIAYSERGISRWSFSNGTVMNDTSWTVASSLRNALDRHDPLASAAMSGLLLEQLCHELGWRVQASVIRRREDKYTLADTWSGIAKILRATLVKDLVDDITRRLAIRNLVGAHYNEWASSISGHEISALGESVLQLHNNVYCAECHNWVEGGRGKPLKCRCGGRDLSKILV